MRQAPSGQRINTDSCVFGDLIMPRGPTESEPERCLDIGCGTGLLAIMMASKFPSACVTAIEPVDELAEIARENAAGCPWHLRIAVEAMRLQDLAAQSGHRFDLIACNPPFFSSGQKSADPIRAMARHNDTLTLQETATGIAALLTPGGTAWILCPAASREDWIAELSTHGLAIAAVIDLTDHPGAIPHASALAFVREGQKRGPSRQAIFYRTGPAGDPSPWMKDYRRRWHP